MLMVDSHIWTSLMLPEEMQFCIRWRANEDGGARMDGFKFDTLDLQASHQGIALFVPELQRIACADH